MDRLLEMTSFALTYVGKHVTSNVLDFWLVQMLLCLKTLCKVPPYVGPDVSNAPQLYFIFIHFQEVMVLVGIMFYNTNSV